MDGFNETIIACGSAYGASVRSVIRLSGKNSLAVLRRFFEPVALPNSQPYILDGNLTIWGERRKIPSTLYYWSDGHGYTGEESVELHTVGSPPVIEALIDVVCASGLVRLAKCGEFTLRAFLNGRIDLTQAEAVLGVIDAESKQSLESALQQLAGGVTIPLAGIREMLFNTLVQLEAGFDFSDEDIEFISNGEVRQIMSNAMVEIERLRRQIGAREVAGERPKVVLAGLPNAGKSSLFNRLLNKNFAIVSDQAGTTRDYLEANITFDGIECQLIDTAGIADNCNNNSSPQNTGEVVETLAQNHSHKMINLADVIIFCVDSDKPDLNNIEFDLFDEEVRECLIVVFTKYDLLKDALSLSQLRTCQNKNKNINSNITSNKLAQFNESQNGFDICRDFVFVSSKSGYGVDDLCSKVGLKLQTYNGNNTIISTASRCREAIHAAYNALNRAINLQIQDDSLIAAEIRATINSLGLIDGTIHTEDILDRIFERFCIGK
ncbi:MAG: tRNA modification GTPase [Planctomycetaceae bacterium]|jgi:tRNA modification GTPase|nr:tRNA modification GTPase [Planctomycetaceae bacterium]